MSAPNTTKKSANQATNLGSLVRQCDFCDDDYEPRRQTRNPRACRKKCCKIARQAANEHEWRDKNEPQWPASYFAAQRKKRHRELTSLAERLCRSLQIGSAMLAEALNGVFLRVVVDQFLRQLGLRRANKLWLPKKPLEIPVVTLV